MKISVVFPSVMYREGPSGVRKLIRAIEEIGFDELDMFDHVVMGYATDSRPTPFYSPKMPIMEAFIMLSFAAAITDRIQLGTGVLVLPQRQITLVAKQVSSLDTLSAGRVRLGVGIGWQKSEYEALNEDFHSRGKRMSEAIQVLRAYWQDEHVNFNGDYYQLDEIAMEPKPPQAGGIPIWIGGTAEPMLKRVGELADGWMAMTIKGDPPIEEGMAKVRRFAEEAGRDPSEIGMQMSLSPGALDREKRKRFYADPELLRERVIELRDLGFDQISIDCVPIFQHGYRTVDAMIDYLGKIYTTIAPELDR
ncbi:MAG: LLM class F420-dependent oxidoreductase [Pseudomonadales bacterium]